jgi:hypothetical protein
MMPPSESDTTRNGSLSPLFDVLISHMPDWSGSNVNSVWLSTRTSSPLPDILLPSGLMGVVDVGDGLAGEWDGVGDGIFVGDGLPETIGDGYGSLLGPHDSTSVKINIQASMINKAAPTTIGMTILRLIFFLPEL